METDLHTGKRQMKIWDIFSWEMESVLMKRN